MSLGFLTYLVKNDFLTWMFVCCRCTFNDVLWLAWIRSQELCESRGGRPGLPSLKKPTVSVDVKQHSTWALINVWWVYLVLQNFPGAIVLTLPSKHAGSDSYPVQIGWEALTRSGPEDSCTPDLPDRIRLAKTWHNQPELNPIGLVLHNVIRNVCGRTEPSLKVGNW